MTDTLARMRQLCGTAADWAANDLTIGAGELALEFETDYRCRVKVGNGSLRYSQLPFSGDPMLRDDLADGTGPTNGAGLVAFDEDIGYGAGTSGMELLRDWCARYLEANAPNLRRAIENRRLPSSSAALALAQATLDGAKHQTTTTMVVDVWYPDGGGTYPSVWLRDMCMSMGGYLDYFSREQIEGAFNWYTQYINRTTYQVPDNVTLAGVPSWLPGGWGARAPVDGNAMIVQMAWLHFIKSGTTRLYDANKDLLRNLLNVGIPYDANGCVYVDPAAPFVTWGFIDTVKLTGSVLFASVLTYIAYGQLAEMAFAAGDYGIAVDCIKRGLQTRAGVNSTLYARTINIGLYKASTGLCSGQLDVWGSCLAVYCGLADDGQAYEISSNLANNFAVVVNAKPNLQFQGGVRHVLRNNDYTNNVKCWEAYFQPTPTYDSYQSGAYWTTPVAWVAYTLALTHPDLAGELVRDLRAEYNYEALFVANTAPAEWYDTVGGYGAKKYCTSAVAQLTIDYCGVDRRGEVSIYSKAGAQSIPAATWTVVAYDTKVIDNVRCWDLANKKFITPETGLYRIDASVRLDALGANSEVVLRACVNGSNASGPVLFDSPGLSGKFITASGSKVLRLGKGDAVDIRIYTEAATTIQNIGEPKVDWTNVYISPVAPLS